MLASGNLKVFNISEITEKQIAWHKVDENESFCCVTCCQVNVWAFLYMSNNSDNLQFYCKSICTALTCCRGSDRGCHGHWGNTDSMNQIIGCKLSSTTLCVNN